MSIVGSVVRVNGGAAEVARRLGVSRSQVYRWIAAGTMWRATYCHVAALAALSNIDATFLARDPATTPSIHPQHPAQTEAEFIAAVAAKRERRL
jgi:transcriptional regulator with XRE-family HTH domain